MGLSTNQIKQVEALNAKVRFSVRLGAQEIANARGQVIQEARPESHVCELIDNITKTVYVTGFGLDADLAFDDAMRLAAITDKPLTPAQQADRDRHNADKAALAAENERLKAELAAATAGRTARKTSLATAE